MVCVCQGESICEGMYLCHSWLPLIKDSAKHLSHAAIHNLVIRQSNCAATALEDKCMQKSWDEESPFCIQG